MLAERPATTSNRFRGIIRDPDPIACCRPPSLPALTNDHERIVLDFENRERAVREAGGQERA
jgi:hypothetical protein